MGLFPNTVLLPLCLLSIGKNWDGLGVGGLGRPWVVVVEDGAAVVPLQMIGPPATAARAGHRDEARDRLVIIDTDGCAIVDALVFAHGKTDMGGVGYITYLPYIATR